MNGDAMEPFLDPANEADDFNVVVEGVVWIERAVTSLIDRPNNNGNTLRELAGDAGNELLCDNMKNMLNHIYNEPSVRIVNPPLQELLHTAVLLNYVEMVKWLLDYELDPGAEGENGETPLHVAVRLKRLAIVRIIFEQAAVRTSELLEAKDANGNTLLLLAAREDCWEIAETFIRDSGTSVPELLRKKNNDNKDIFALSIEHQNANFLEHLLIHFEHDTEFQRLLEEGSYPMLLHCTARHGSSKGTRMLMAAKVKLVADAQKQTALHLAAKCGHGDVMELLLKAETVTCHTDGHNTIINERDDSGNTALHYAAENGHADICEDLIKHGADVSAQNNASQVPFELAIMKAHSDCARVFCKVCKINDHFSSGLAPLHLAAQRDREGIVATLLEVDDIQIELETKEKEKRNAFEIALECKNLYVYQYINKEEAKQL